MSASRASGSPCPQLTSNSLTRAVEAGHIVSLPRAPDDKLREKVALRDSESKGNSPKESYPSFGKTLFQSTWLAAPGFSQMCEPKCLSFSLYRMKSYAKFNAQRGGTESG